MPHCEHLIFYLQIWLCSTFQCTGTDSPSSYQYKPVSNHIPHDLLCSANFGLNQVWSGREKQFLWTFTQFSFHVHIYCAVKLILNYTHVSLEPSLYPYNIIFLFNKMKIDTQLFLFLRNALNKYEWNETQEAHCNMSSFNWDFERNTTIIFVININEIFRLKANNKWKSFLFHSTAIFQWKEEKKCCECLLWPTTWNDEAHSI